jgi:hypothetical protein
VTISVNAAVPTVDDGSTFGDQDGAITGTVTGSDPQNRTLAFAIASGTSNGTITMNDDGSYSYCPNIGYVGTDYFTFMATNGTETSAAGTVAITVNAATPTVDDGAYEIDQGGMVCGTVTGSDPQNRLLTFAIAAGPSNGSLTMGDDGSYSYTPNADFNGTDTFTFIATNGTQTSTAGTVTITVDQLEIIEFDAQDQNNGDGFWVFSGQVSGLNSAGASISFGDFLAGYSTNADVNGAFSITAFVGDLSDGTVTATAYSSCGGQSVTVDCNFRQVT